MHSADPAPLASIPAEATRIAAAVAGEIERHRDAVVAHTQRILQFRTVSGGNPEEQADYEREIPACFEWLGEQAAAMGFTMHLVDGVVGVLEWKHKDPAAPVVAVPVHIDVVTAQGQWRQPPFSGALVDGEVWGRGALDDKGPLVQVLHGMAALKRAGIDPGCSIRLVIGTMEETSDWSDMRRYLEAEGAPDYGFTPDAEFAIINGEKGMISFQVDAEWDTGIGESPVALVALHGGERENIVPSRAQLRFRFPATERTAVLKELVRTSTAYQVEHAGSNVTLIPEQAAADAPGFSESVLTFIGRAAHSSTPAKGHNAILDAVDFLKDLDAMPAGLRHFATFLLIACKDLRGENIGIASSHDFTGETTVSLSLIEVLEGRGRALVNVRPTMGMTCESVIAQATRAAAEFTSVTGLPLRVTQKGPGKDAVFLDPANPAVRPFIESLQQGFQAVTGLEPRLRAIGGTTYAKAIPNCCAFGPVLVPDEPELIHQPDERVTVEAIIRNAKIYGTSLGLLSLHELGKNTPC